MNAFSGVEIRLSDPSLDVKQDPMLGLVPSQRCQGRALMRGTNASKQFTIFNEAKARDFHLSQSGRSEQVDSP